MKNKQNTVVYDASIVIRHEKRMTEKRLVRNVVLNKSKFSEDEFNRMISNGEINKLIVPIFNNSPSREEGTSPYMSIAVEGDLVLGFKTNNGIPTSDPYQLNMVVPRLTNQDGTPAFDPSKPHRPADLTSMKMSMDLLLAITNSEVIQKCFRDSNWEPTKEFLKDGMFLKEFYQKEQKKKKDAQKKTRGPQFKGRVK